MRKKPFDSHFRTVCVRFREEDYQKLKHAAKLASKPMSVYIRIAILNKLYERKK